MPRILKYNTKVEYDVVFLRENQPPPAYHSLYFSLIKLQWQTSHLL